MSKAITQVRGQGVVPTMSRNTRQGFIELNPFGWNNLAIEHAYRLKEKAVPSLQKMLGYFEKGDTSLLVNTTAVWNIVYGKAVWDWINREANVFSLLPKVPWEKSGERILTGDPSTDIFQGVADNGALPDAQIPTYALHGTKHKCALSRFQYTRHLAVASKLGDDVLSLDEYRNWAAKAHVLGTEKAICENVEATGAGLGADYTGKNTFEAIDRIISTDEEEDDCGGTYNNVYDPWQQYAQTAWDRDNATTYDAVLVHGDGTYTVGSISAFTTDSALSTEALDVLTDETQNAGADPARQALITGYDTYRRIRQLLESRQRFMGSARVVKTVNGVATVAGAEAGFPVSTYNDIPVFRAKNVPKDTISKIFCVDLSKLYFKVVTPTILMAPDEAESYLGLDRLAHDHWFLTEGETWCTNVKVQGKLRSAS